jgi:hypothetical protein
MSKLFNPFDWCWVKSDGKTVYSSKSQSYLTTGTKAFKAWAADDTAPTLWPKDETGEETDAALQAVLSEYGLMLPDGEQSTETLKAYAEAKRATLASGGFAYNVAASGKPAEVIEANTDLVGRLNLSGLVTLAQMDAEFTSTWVQSGAGRTLTAAQIIALGVAVGTFVEQTYRTFAKVLAGIADGSITKRAQIDAAKWPDAAG